MHKNKCHKKAAAFWSFTPRITWCNQHKHYTQVPVTSPVYHRYEFYAAAVRLHGCYACKTGTCNPHFEKRRGGYTGCNPGGDIGNQLPILYKSQLHHDAALCMYDTYTAVHIIVCRPAHMHVYCTTTCSVECMDVHTFPHTLRICKLLK